MEKIIRIICLILITIAVLIAVGFYIQKEILYLNAYNNCIKDFGATPRASWMCIGFLNGVDINQ